MSESPIPEQPQEPVPISYLTPNPLAAGNTHVKLTMIFNFVASGLDFLFSLAAVGFVIFFTYISRTGGAAFGPPGARAFPESDMWMMVGMYSVYFILSTTVGTLKLIAAMKLYRRSPTARRWGYIAGIAGCTQIWCSACCIIPMACGIYTIVAVSLESTRAVFESFANKNGTNSLN